MKTMFAKLASLALLLTAVAIHSGTPASAGNRAESFPAAAAQAGSPTKMSLNFTAIDLQENQTARIKAVIDPNFAIGPEVRAIEVEFAFLDKDGKVVASQKKMLRPGHSESFEMRAGAIIHDRTGLQARLTIRGAVGPEIRKALVTTLEVADTKGKTLSVKKNPRLVIGPEI
ncbi:MAG: hypothetical protein ACXW18_06835 [Pyrinomonadaceae bacterium]